MNTDISMRSYLILRDDIKIEVEDNLIKIKSTPVHGNEDTLMFISKSQAVILLLFDGTSTIVEVCERVAKLFNIDYEKGESCVLKTMEIFGSLFTPLNNRLPKNNIELIKDIICNPDIKLPKHDNLTIERNPEELILFLTDDCSSKCIYCYMDSRESGDFRYSGKALTLSEICKIASDARRLGIHEVQLTGGEPLLHRNIIEIINIFIQEDFEVSISTKKPFDEAFAEKLKAAGLKEMQISLDTLTPHTYEKLIGVPAKNLDNTIMSIKYLINKGIACKIKSTVTSLNIFEIPEVIEYLFSLGCKSFELQAYFKGHRHDPQLYPEIEDYEWLLQKLNGLRDKHNDINIIEGFDPEYIRGSEKFRKITRMDCLAGKSSVVIYSDGSYGYCGHSSHKLLRFGNFREMTIEEAWNCEQMQNFINPDRKLYAGTQCEECADFKACNLKRCYVRTIIHFNKLYEIDPMCHQSSICYSTT